jgi:hypothetical protein
MYQLLEVLLLQEVASAVVQDRLVAESLIPQ